MLAQDAKAIAQKWAEDNNLPLDLRGKVFFIPSFPDEETARFFNPKRSLQAHQLIINQLARIARKRGGKIQRRMINEADFIAWQTHAINPHTGDAQFISGTDKAAFMGLCYRIEDRA